MKPFQWEENKVIVLSFLTQEGWHLLFTPTAQGDLPVPRNAPLPLLHCYPPLLLLLFINTEARPGQAASSIHSGAPQSGAAERGSQAGQPRLDGYASQRRITPQSQHGRDRLEKM